MIADVASHATLPRLLLAIFGLVPIGLWSALAANLDPSGFGRNIGIAILVLLAPLPFAGLLMCTGAWMLVARPKTGRIVGTLGASMLGVGAGLLALLWIRRIGWCGSFANCWDELWEPLAGLAFALCQAGLIVLLWRRAAGAHESD